MMARLKRSRIFTPQTFVEISKLVEQGLSASQISERIGCTPNSLRVKCSQAGISLRRDVDGDTPRGRLTVRIYGSIALHLQQQAIRQGRSGTKYAAALLEAIVRDNLYNAVLDQESLVNDRLSQVAAGLSNTAAHRRRLPKES